MHWGDLMVENQENVEAKGFAAGVRENGAAIERSVQIATGAVYLAILSSLASNWGELVESSSRSQEPLLTAFFLSGLAFVFTLFATVLRSISLGAFAKPSRRPAASTALAWAGNICVAVVLMVWQGWFLIAGMSELRAAVIEVGSLHRAT
jgi:hypothetical protein